MRASQNCTREAGRDLRHARAGRPLTSNAPSHRATVKPVKKIGRQTTATASITGISKLTADDATAIPEEPATAAIPCTPRMLKMLLPTTLPIAISCLPLKLARTEVTSSGADVPRATMVRPITSSLRPRERASADEPETSHSAPMARATTPPATAATPRKASRPELP